MSSLLGKDQMEKGISDLADAIAKTASSKPVAVVGIRSRGDEVAERITSILSQKGCEVEFGTLDISLYRDDYEHLRENPKLKGSDISFDIENAHIILVDDVLFTGRTIRAALDAISHYGRPAKIELAVLIDRGHREMPIQPDYVGIKLDTTRHDHVYVWLEKTDGEDKIEIKPSE